MTRYEYSIINVDAENEHFDISDSVISWMENCKSSMDENPKESLSTILPTPSSAHHQSSASGVAWNLVQIFSKKQGLNSELVELSKAAIDNCNQDLTIDEELANKFDQQIRILKDNTKQSIIFPLENEDLKQSNNLIDTRNPSTTTNNGDDAGDTNNHVKVRMRGNDEWAPPRAQIIFNVHEEANFRKSMQKQNYRCAGCGTKIDLELARRLVLFCHYLGKYFCKCCFSHKTIHLPGYILQKWDFHKYPVSHFALQLLDRIANEPLFNINDINPSLYRKVKKLKNLIDIRMQLYYLKIYITTCPQADKLNDEYVTFTQQHLLQDDVHLYSLNNLIEVQHGKLFEYLSDLVSRSIAHIAQCDRCRAKGHYCQLCGPSSLMSSMISSGAQQQQQQQQLSNNSDQQQVSTKLKGSISVGQGLSSMTSQYPKDSSNSRQPQDCHSRSSSGTYSNFAIPIANNPMAPPMTTIATMAATIASAGTVPINDHELIFPFEIGRVAQCRVCGCCFHLQCFVDAGQNCPKCERIQRRRAESPLDGGHIDTASSKTAPVTAAS